MKNSKLSELYEEKDIVCLCCNCKQAKPLHYAYGEYLCMLHGVVGAEFSCKHFSYDLTKRIPASHVAKPEDSQNNFQGTQSV